MGFTRQPNPSLASTPHRGHSVRRAGGFTLLEVLLVLLLMALLLVAIAMAVDLHLRVANLGRKRVEEAQLARAILQRIADDIRRAVREPPVPDGDFSVPEASEESSASAESPEDPGSSENESLGLEAIVGDQEADTMEMFGMDDTSLFDTSPSRPGIYGGSDWIQIDASRAVQPALFEMVGSGWDESPDTTSSQSDTDNLLGDVKTVVYALNWGPFSQTLPTSASESSLLVSGDQSATSTGSWSLSRDDLPPGLYRRQLDRAAMCWMQEQGLDDALSDFYESDLLAPEVESLSLAYFDGTQWFDSWDSQANGGLPLAVEILLSINMEPAPENSVLAPSALQQTDARATEQPTVYRLVVYLPVAAQADSSEETEETAAEQAGTRDDGRAAESDTGTGGAPEEPSSTTGESSGRPTAPGSSSGADRPEATSPGTPSPGGTPASGAPGNREDANSRTGRPR